MNDDPFADTAERQAAEKKGWPRFAAATSYLLFGLPFAAYWAVKRPFIRHHLFHAAAFWSAFLATGLTAFFVIARRNEIAGPFWWLLKGEDARVILTVPFLFGGCLGGATWLIMLVGKYFESVDAAANGRFLVTSPAWAAMRIALFAGGGAAALGVFVGFIIFLSQALGC